MMNSNLSQGTSGSIDHYSVEVFFHKDKPSLDDKKVFLDKVPKIEEYSSDTIIESISLEPEKDIHDEIKIKYPDAVYVHVIEFQREFR